MAARQARRLRDRVRAVRPGHDRSGAGGESRLFRTAYLEGSHYVPLLRRSRAEWERLGADTGVRLLHMTGGLMIGTDGSAFLDAVGRSIDEHGIDHEFLDTDALRSRYPQHAVRTGDVAYLDHESGYLRPEVAVALAASEAERLGGVVHRRARVEEIRMTDAAVEVHTDDRVFRFPASSSRPASGRPGSCRASRRCTRSSGSS
ncbi:FAD-dependent oxidoreductase [Curtobacterium flaccumfaciens]|nr:FAD-dependent oxidoreductase [Curtobacterium flaccumfaciens]